MNNLVQSINGDTFTRYIRGLALSQRFASSISWFLMLLIIILLVLFSWSIWDYFQPRTNLATDQMLSSNTGKQKSFNINKLTSYHFFGNPKLTRKTTISDQINAPVTRLKLKLRGVYSSSDEVLAGAMIEAQNKQQVYRIGDKLPGATGLKLHSIQSDRVIMSRGTKFETLLIEDFGKLAGVSNSRATLKRTRVTSNIGPNGDQDKSQNNNQNNVLDKRKDANLTKDLIALRSKLTDPKSLSELISVSQAMVEGDFIGFRLAPGKDRALFGRLGLRRNDIVTNINGISLDDPATAFTLMEQISSADEIDLTIKRGDRVMNVLFSATIN